MAKKDRYAQGEFSWMELTTTDVKKAKSFYGDLFGWTFDDMPAGPGMTYSMGKLGNEHVCGLFEMGPEMAAAVPPHWASYVTVEDVDAVTKKAAANGAKVHKEPFDVMDVGRMSVLEDPTGAMFCLWQAKKHIGAGVKNEPGALCWNELLTTDPAAAAKFYTSTLGWTTEVVDMGPGGKYTLLNAAGVPNNVGGMTPIPAAMKGAPSHWTVFVEVEDCDASTKKANDLGAKTVSPPTDIPNIGRFSIIQDPTGASIALYKNAH
ncbi:MAG TPA: VOC family protein [Labilithrix sp.]|nr:VOC family protein [Labilithrix sp.]